MSHITDKPWLGKFRPVSLAMPLGFDQGDPLIVCRSNKDEDLARAYLKLKIKGYYCGPASNIGGRRHDKVFLDLSGGDWSHDQFTKFWNWIAHNVMTTSPPGGFKGVYFV